MGSPSNTTCTGSEDTTIQGYVNDYINENVPNGLALGYYSNSASSYLCCGNAIVPDSGDPAPVDASTIFGLQSVTKVFTAAMMAAKHVAGHLDIDGKVTHRLPALTDPNSITDVTYRMLAQYSSTMPKVGGGKPGVNLFKDQPPSQELISFWEKWKSDGTPGDCYRYSNVGFVTLGYAVAAEGPDYTSYPYNKTLANLVTAPLGLPDTGAYGVLPSGVTVAQGYDGDNNPVSSTPTDLMSNVTDLLTFLVANIEAKTAPPSMGDIYHALRMTHTTMADLTNCGSDGGKADSDEGKTSVGLGWFFGHSDGVHYCFKDGGGYGFMSWIGFSVDKGCAVALLANRFPTAGKPHLGDTGLSILKYLCKGGS